VNNGEHLSPISNLYTQTQRRFNKVNILLLSQTLYTKTVMVQQNEHLTLSQIILQKTVTVQQSEHLYPISNQEKDVHFVELSLFLCLMI
jgi:hypothetical protein